jgi:hypothetical protein
MHDLYLSSFRFRNLIGCTYFRIMYRGQPIRDLIDEGRDIIYNELVFPI